MSEQNKIYAPISAKEVRTQHGTILKLSFHVDKLGDWVAQHRNEKGYINLCVTPRKEVSQYKETHTVWLDTWKPSTQNERQTPAPAPVAKQAIAEMRKAVEKPESDDPVPF